MFGFYMGLCFSCVLVVGKHSKTNARMFGCHSKDPMLLTQYNIANFEGFVFEHLLNHLVFCILYCELLFGILMSWMDIFGFY